MPLKTTPPPKTSIHYSPGEYKFTVTVYGKQFNISIHTIEYFQNHGEFITNVITNAIYIGNDMKNNLLKLMPAYYGETNRRPGTLNITVIGSASPVTDKLFPTDQLKEQLVTDFITDTIDYAEYQLEHWKGVLDTAVKAKEE